MTEREFREVGDVSVDAGRGPGQMGWYRFAADLVAGHSVVDIGCGLGRGLEVLRGKATQVSGQDQDDRLAAPGIFIGPVSAIPDKQHDFVTCIDVVEHVEQDRQFVRELARIARKGIIMTTPLSTYGRKIWPYHIREYTFDQLIALCSPLGQCSYWKGTPSGDRWFAIDNVERFLWMHRLLNNPLSNLPMRALQKLLPEPARNMAHQAVLIRLA